MDIKVVTNEDGQRFVWKVIDGNTAKDVFHNGSFPLFVLYEDDTEKEIQEYDVLLDAYANGYDIGIEVGFLPD